MLKSPRTSGTRSISPAWLIWFIPQAAGHAHRLQHHGHRHIRAGSRSRSRFLFCWAAPSVSEATGQAAARASRQTGQEQVRDREETPQMEVHERKRKKKGGGLILLAQYSLAPLF